MRKQLAVLLALALVASACVRTSDVGGNRPVTVGAIGANALTLFDSCDDYLDYARAEAIARVTAYGLDGYGYYGGGFGVDDVAVLEREESAPATTVAASSESSGQADAALGSDGGGGDFSESNVQVAGIDEPDLVKTDGERIFVLANGSLYVLNTDGDLLGSQRLEIWTESMFIYEDTVVVFSSDWGSYRGFGAGSPITEVLMLDVSDPSDISIVERLRVDGSQVSARLIDNQMRLVVSAVPLGFEWVYPQGSGLRSESAALEANKKLIEDSTVDNWLPYYVHTGPAGDTEGVLVQCSNAFHPSQFSGFELLTIVTLDLARGSFQRPRLA